MSYHGQVVGITIYQNDVVVRREGAAPPLEETERGAITEFSAASRKRLAFVASNTPIVFTAMVTLTYPAEYPRDGAQVKRDLGAFLDYVRRVYDGPPYLWFLEFQKRGAPHVHMLLDIAWPTDPDAVKRLRVGVAAAWYRIVGSGDDRHFRAGTRTEKLRSPEGGARYAVKYAMKMRQKAVPPDYWHCGRFWGHSSDVRPKAGASYRCTEDDIRGTLEGQPYAPRDDGPLWKVLYNKADYFRDYLEGDLTEADN
jgi:hypothetical protein